MRKHMLLILSLNLVIALLVPLTFCANITTVNGAEVNVGDIITYELTIDRADDIAIALQLEIYFNDDILKIKNAECYNLTSYVLNPNKNNNNAILLNASSLKGYDFTNGNDLLRVDFEVISKGNTKIIENFVCFCDINYDDVGFEYSHILKKNNINLVEKEIETVASTIASAIEIVTTTETIPVLTTTMCIGTTASFTSEVIETSTIVTDATEPTTEKVITTTVAETMLSTSQELTTTIPTQLTIPIETDPTELNTLNTTKAPLTTTHVTEPIVSTHAETSVTTVTSPEPSTKFATSNSTDINIEIPVLTEATASKDKVENTHISETSPVYAIDVPSTGENNKTILFFDLALASCIVLVAVVMFKKKR
ncbi:MAG: hypothetical protein IJ341_02090 [Bacteroidales bacterium]|nr:hypothetical protein [Bacteroidales bacterium]